MASSSQHSTNLSSDIHRQTTLPPKRSLLEMRSSEQPAQWVNQEHYVNHVLRLPSNTTEEEIVRNLRQQAEELGLNPVPAFTNVETVASSLSATTIASNPTTQSLVSQSTAPTSCSSSETKPIAASLDKVPLTPHGEPDPLSATLSDIEKKRRNTGFRKGFRRMTGLTKKKKTPMSPALASIGSFSDFDVSVNGDSHSVVSEIKSPSIISKESSGLWSQRRSTAEASNTSHSDRDRDNDHELENSLIDHDALRRSIEDEVMMSLRARQLAERQRFLKYQSELVSNIRSQRDIVAAQKRLAHERILEELRAKNDKAVEELESRHLEEESKMRKEHDHEKRSVMVRLRHMEAYCQTPSPPPTPSDHTNIPRIGSSGNLQSGRDSLDSLGASPISVTIPERRVTDKDYHNLAQQYRERDAMDTLHTSRINVLRGRQQRALEKFMSKRENDVEKLEDDQHRELEVVEVEYGRQEADCRSEFDLLRRSLEDRWRLEAQIERKRREDATGLSFEKLPDIKCVDNCNIEILLRPPNSRKPRDLTRDLPPIRTTVAVR